MPKNLINAERRERRHDFTWLDRLEEHDRPMAKPHPGRTVSPILKSWFIGCKCSTGLAHTIGPTRRIKAIRYRR
jgi:hypothetical protein